MLNNIKFSLSSKPKKLKPTFFPKNLGYLQAWMGAQALPHSGCELALLPLMQGPTCPHMDGIGSVGTHFKLTKFKTFHILKPHYVAVVNKIL